MIIVRAPMRISFVGGGTDLPDFYTASTGRVISAAIDKYVYVAINPTPLIEKVTARYSSYEVVDHPSELKNKRMRAALLDLGILSNIDISTFSHLPEKTGLGSSSSFSVALMKGLYCHLNKHLDSSHAAEVACRLEIELLGEPIGKQDQYAAAFGGVNIFQFNRNHTVDVEPVFLDFNRLFDFKNNLLLFFTGMTRAASSVLTEQKREIPNNMDSLKRMSDMPLEFREYLMRGEDKKIGELLHRNWVEKKRLATNISNRVIDDLYDIALDAGAWGGKILGAGNGGCLLFIAPNDKKNSIRTAIRDSARKHELEEFREIPFNFVQSGVEIAMNHKSSSKIYSEQGS